MPTQATNTTSGNWRARYASEFYDKRGRHWRVELIDHTTTNTAASEFNLTGPSYTPHDVELAEDGFTLQWDGPSDHVGAALIPSSCEVTFAITTSAMEPLVSVIKSADDNRFGLAVYYDDGSTNWKPWWVGTLNHEAVEYETKDRPYLVTITASCGLNRLRNIEFNDNGDAYLQNLSFAECIAICLNKLPTADFWNSSETQLNEIVDLFNTGHFTTSGQWSPSAAGDVFPKSVIERTITASAAFYEAKEPKEDEFGRRAHYPLNFNSCFDVLESVTVTLGARMFLTRFGWWFVPMNSYNWSHQLQVNSWTRTQVASESISTAIVSGYNEDTASTSTIQFEQDLEATHALGDGWSNSYLLPVKRATVTLKNAGQRSVFGVPRHFYLDYPSIGSDSTKGFTNSNVVVSEGDTLNVRGTYTSGDLVKEFGLLGAAVDDHGTDRIGARIIVRLKIKVGSLYYGSEHSVGTETTTIDMPAGTGGDLSSKTVTVADPAWTSSEQFFDIVVPWTHSNPEAATVDSGGTNRVGGLHTRINGSEFEYKINQTQQDDVAHEFDFITVPLPNNSSSYTGIEVKIDRIVLTCDGNVRQTFPQLDDIFQSVAIVNYDYQGNALGGFTQSAPEDRIENFVVGIGNNSDDGDVDIFAEQDANTEFLDLGETVLGDNVVGGVPQSDGALSVIQCGGTTTNAVFTSTNWRSVTDGIDGLETDATVLVAMTREQLYMRGKVAAVQRGRIVPKYSTASNTTLPMDMLTVMSHNCTTESDLVEYLVPLRMQYVGGQAAMNVDAVIRNRQRLSFDAVVEPRPTKGPNGSGNGPNGGIAPSGMMGASSTETFENSTNGDLVSISSSVSTNTTNITSNTTNIASIKNVLQDTTGGGGQGIYTDSSKATTSSFLGLTTTTATLQAGAGNTAIDLSESSPGQIEMAVQVGASPSETSATAIDIQGTTSSQVPNITFNGNISGIELNDLDNVNATPSDGQSLVYNSASSNWIAQTVTGGGGGGSGDVVDDTTPQLGGDLDLNSNNITGTGDINTTGTLTTSGLATLPGIALGSTGILGTGAIQTTGNIGTLGSGTLSVAGTSSFSGNASFNADLLAAGLQFTGSGTNTIGPSGTGGTQDDLEVRSNGNVTVVLDYDSDEAAQAFIVKNQAGTVIFQVDEDGVTSGLLTTATPTLSGAASSYGQSSSVSGISVSNHVSGRTYEAKIFNSSGTEQTSNPVTVDSSGNITFTAPSTAATGYELRIAAADVGKFKSLEATATFEVTPSRTFEYWRVQGVDSSGNASANKAAFVELDFYTGANATGTETPTSDATSATSISGVTISSGYQHSSTYANWRAFDGTTHGSAAAGSMWWTLGNSNADLVWIQVQFSSAQTFESLKLTVYNSFNDATHIIVKGSNTGSFSGEEVSFGLTAINETGSAGITTANF